MALRDEVMARLVTAPDGDPVLVFGGDGFLLKTVAELGFSRAYLGVNAGTLGFLLNRTTDPDELVDRLTDEAWTTHAFPLLHGRIHKVDGTIVEAFAVNDIYLERATGQAAWLDLWVGEHRAVTRMVADGLILATSLGSTAYTFSAGGSPSHPHLPALHVTPICPHSPRLPPFLLPDTARLRVDVRAFEKRPVRASVDGRAIEDVVAAEVWLSRRTVQFAYFDDHDFTRSLLHHIRQPG